MDKYACLTSVHSKFKTTSYLSVIQKLYMTESVYSMVLFSFQGNANTEERVGDKKIPGSCIQVQIFLKLVFYLG